jgi:hypothetical protein
VFDGTTDYVIAKVGIHSLFNYGGDYQGVLSLLPYSDTLLIISTYDGDGATGRGRVMLLDVTSGDIKQLGPETALVGTPATICVYAGRIWIGTAVFNLTQGKVYSVRIGDATLTQETGFVVVNGEGVAGMATFKGDLYVSTSASWATFGLFAHVMKRAAGTGAWSTVLTGDGTGSGNYIGPLIVAADGLTIYGLWSSVSGGAAPIVRIMKSTDGTTWTQELDIVALVGGVTYAFSGYPVLDTNGDIYWPVLSPGSGDGKTLKRAFAGGAWTVVDTSTIRGTINWRITSARQAACSTRSARAVARPR